MIRRQWGQKGCRGLNGQRGGEAAGGGGGGGWRRAKGVGGGNELIYYDARLGLSYFPSWKNFPASNALFVYDSLLLQFLYLTDILGYWGG